MKKEVMYLPMFLVTMLLLAGLGYAACTFVTPASSGTIKGTTVNFNASSCSFAAVHNCTVTGSSSATGDSQSFWLYNITDAGNSANATVNTGSWRDGADWTFSGTCYNISGSTESLTAITSVVVDNTVPAISACTIDGTSASSTQEVGASSYQTICTVKNATTCTISWKGVNGTMGTDTSTTDCTFTASSSYAGAGFSTTCNLKQADDAYANMYYSCTDGTNRTSTSTYQVRTGGYSQQQLANLPGSKENVALANFEKVKSNKNVIIFGFVIVICIIAALVLVVKKKR